MRLIDADALYDKTEEIYKNAQAPYRMIYRGFVDTVADAPTISPDSLRERGRWEKSRYNGFLWCSVCKNCYVDDHWPNDEKWKFCPSCGAKMDLEG